MFRKSIIISNQLMQLIIFSSIAIDQTFSMSNQDIKAELNNLEIWINPFRLFILWQWLIIPV